MNDRQAAIFALFVLGLLPLGARPLWAQDMIFADEDIEVTQDTANPPVPPANPPPGQWVYTKQYEWVWMPYAESYTRVPDDGSPPTMFLYYPAGGWCWVDAPWVWGWGPAPFFGALGPGRFIWFGVGSGFGHFQHAGRAGFGHPGFGFRHVPGRALAGRGFAGRGFSGFHQAGRRR